MEKINFPVYRKYKNTETYFKIDSVESFEEIRSLGKKWIVETHKAKILPDHHLINDLLYNFSEFADEIAPEIYSEIRKQII